MKFIVWIIQKWIDHFFTFVFPLQNIYWVILHFEHKTIFLSYADMDVMTFNTFNMNDGNIKLWIDNFREQDLWKWHKIVLQAGHSMVKFDKILNDTDSLPLMVNELIQL